MKKRRTAAQIRATKKLVAFNKARGRLNKKRAGSPKRKTAKHRTPAQIRATKKLVALNKKRTAPKRKHTRSRYCYLIMAVMGPSYEDLFYHDGNNHKKSFGSRAGAKKFRTKKAATDTARNLLSNLRVPSVVRGLKIIKAL